MAAAPSTTLKITPSISTSINQPSLIFTNINIQRKSKSLKLKTSFRVACAGPSTPSDISEKVLQSIKAAEETCAENAESGECAAAWDEVEELSAAASHARDKLKPNNDPLENYCKDNPETDECRTYED